MQPAHCLPEACVVGTGPGLGLPSVSQYSDYVTTVTSHHQPVSDALSYSASHPAAAVTDFATSAMYVNTVWGEQPPAPHPQPPPGAGVYYESYPTYGGYPGHMLSGQDGGMPPGYPGMPGGAGAMGGRDLELEHQMSGPGGKRKRRRVITYEQRKAANVRERKRMCHLNDAFDVLRKRVPTFAYEKKLSRIETLKLAVTYIQYMAELLEDLEDETGNVKKTGKGVGTPGSAKSEGSAGEEGVMTPISKDTSLCSPSSTSSDCKENSPTGAMLTLVAVPSNDHMDHQSEGVLSVGSHHEHNGQNVMVEVVNEEANDNALCSSQQPLIPQAQQQVDASPSVMAPTLAVIDPPQTQPSSGAPSNDDSRLSPTAGPGL